MSTCGVCGTPLTPGMGHACFRPARVVQSGYDRSAELRERVDELRAWARNRIACCDAVLTGRAGDVSTHGMIARQQERDTLEVVLRLLDKGHV